MRILRRMVAAGYGEVELHYHHNFDTVESLKAKLESAIAFFQRFGFLETVDGQTRFGFVHGNFSLDNSNGPDLCGVNREVALLAELGCFADYSFPSIYLESQPPFVNALYAVKDDDRPKSYDKRLPLEALEPTSTQASPSRRTASINGSGPAFTSRSVPSGCSSRCGDTRRAATRRKRKRWDPTSTPRSRTWRRAITTARGMSCTT
jgi:hypothetical protein